MHIQVKPKRTKRRQTRDEMREKSEMTLMQNQQEGKGPKQMRNEIRTQKVAIKKYKVKTKDQSPHRALL